MKSEMETINRLDHDAIIMEPENPTAALEKWKSARILAEEQLRSNSTPDWNYIVGYLSYMLFSRGACSFDSTEQHLITGLESRSNQGLARFYLAALYFDTGKFGEAITQLEHIYKNGGEYYRNNGQWWRYVKSVEMLAAAKIAEDSWFEARVIGQHLEDICRGCGDDCESMIPLALVGALEKRPSYDPAYCPLCYIAARIVRLTNSQDAISELFPIFYEKWLKGETQMR